MERQAGHGEQIVEMPVSVDAGDRSAELGQVSRSHAVLTIEHLVAQNWKPRSFLRNSTQCSVNVETAVTKQCLSTRICRVFVAVHSIRL